MDIEIETTPDYTLCRPSGELDAYTVDEFRNALGGVVDADALLIDLSGTLHIGDSGLLSEHPDVEGASVHEFDDL